MADSLITAAKEVLGDNVEEHDSVDPDLLEEHQEQLREQMTGGAGGCLHVSLAADALRKNGDAEGGSGDADERSPQA